jgi:hypothetical protein
MSDSKVLKFTVKQAFGSVKVGDVVTSDQFGVLELTDLRKNGFLAEDDGAGTTGGAAPVYTALIDSNDYKTGDIVDVTTWTEEDVTKAVEGGQIGLKTA